MAALMVYAGAVAGDARVTRIGGIPLVPAGFSWPAGRACAGPMQFLAQVMLGDLGAGSWQGVLSVFMCGGDPGMCEEWDAAAGGNRALVFAGGSLAPAAVPAGPAAMLGEVSAVQYVAVDADYDDAPCLGRARGPSRERGAGPAWRSAVVGAGGRDAGLTGVRSAHVLRGPARGGP